MPEQNVYWYVLFVRTGAEIRVAERLKKEPGNGSFSPFVPQKVCIFRRQGKKSHFQKICFPGYVFIESDKPALEFIDYTYPIIYKQKEAYRFLCYENKADIAMRDEERIALSRILGVNKKIDISQGFKEGDSVKIISGALAGNEGMIQRINKGRQEALIGAPIFGTMISVSVGLEIIEKVNG